jgi:shikimate dehydrogenase
MKLYGLIGFPLGHSFSKQFFNNKFSREGLSDCTYENFPIENIGLFRNLIQNNPQLLGLNVTIPYKESIISFLDNLDDTAFRIGAVNTVKFIHLKDRVELKGFNTDVIGFRESLIPLLTKNIRSELVLGSGGASKAIKYVLAELGILSVTVSRNPDNNPGSVSWTDIDSLLSENLLIINTTPLGSFPNISNLPELPYNMLSNQHLLYDLIYNPSETLFLQKGKEMGARTNNGLEMLELQALASWEIWNR